MISVGEGSIIIHHYFKCYSITILHKFELIMLVKTMLDIDCKGLPTFTDCDRTDICNIY
jgi:hypothetical protein